MIKIEMQNVRLYYGHKPILEDINLQVMPGKMVGLIGPNGSGKSTIIKALSHVVSPRSGKIILDGKDITGIPRQTLADRPRK